MELQTSTPWVQRHAPPHPVETGSYLSRRTLLRIPGQPFRHPCRITDCSVEGYRAVILSPRPDAGRHFSTGQEVELEHADGWRRMVGVRWVNGNVLGLEILNPVTRIIIPRENGEPEPHDCDLLGVHGELFRVTIPDEPSLCDQFGLELPNGETLQVRVRWAMQGEICLQPVRPNWRL